MTKASHSLDGAWKGHFAYRWGAGLTTPFLAAIEEDSVHVSGRTVEPDALGRGKLDQSAVRIGGLLLPKKEEVGDRVARRPDDRVLLQPCPQRFGRLQGQAEDQMARFTRPLIGRVLADPLDAGKAALVDFASQGGMPFGIGFVVKDLAEGVAGCDVRAEVDAIALVR